MIAGRCWWIAPQDTRSECALYNISHFFKILFFNHVRTYNFQIYSLPEKLQCPLKVMVLHWENSDNTSFTSTASWLCRFYIWCSSHFMIQWWVFMTQSFSLQFSEWMKKEHKNGAGGGCTINKHRHWGRKGPDVTKCYYTVTHSSLYQECWWMFHSPRESKNLSQTVL